jgi:hypothetical protein
MTTGPLPPIAFLFSVAGRQQHTGVDSAFDFRTEVPHGPEI